jgi:hypothetical protein
MENFKYQKSLKFLNFGFSDRKTKGGVRVDEVIGKWAFLIGLVVAVVVGFVDIPYAAVILLVLGLIVGFLNIAAKETTQYLVAAIALMTGAVALSVAAVPGMVGDVVANILGAFVAFIAAAALVVAVKAIIELSSKK